jgi:hypothetical protein
VFLIQRRAPGEKNQYWGRAVSEREGWIVEPPRLRFAQVGQSVVPRSACRYERFEVALDVAEALRMKNREHGVVIAIVPDPETAAA